jgi:O-antigen ligase
MSQSLPASDRGLQLAVVAGGALLFLLLAVAAMKGTLLLWFLAAIIGLIGVVFLTQKPYLGVLVLLIFWLLQRSPLFAVIRPLQLQYLVGVVLVIPLGLAIFRDRRVWVLQIPQIKLLLAIGALFLVSTWWNNLIRPDLLPELDETIPWTRAFVVLFAFLIFFLYFVDTRKKIEVAAWFTIALIAVSAVSAMLPFLQGDEVRRVRAEFGIAENSNRLAYMCLFAASMVWFYYNHGTGWLKKTIVLPAFFVLIATALASGSRSGFLQLLILAGIILKEQKNWSMTKRIQGVLLIGSLVVALLAVVPTAQFTRMTSFSSAAAAKSTGGKSMRDRLRTIYSALEMAVSNPVLGIGLGNFVWMHKAYYGIENATHNSYLWMLTEGGIGVLLLYLVLFNMTYRMLRQLETRGPPEFLWLSKALRVNMVLFMIFTAFANFWISIFVYLIVGLTLCMARVWHDSTQPAALAARAVA